MNYSHDFTQGGRHVLFFNEHWTVVINSRGARVTMAGCRLVLTECIINSRQNIVWSHKCSADALITE